MNAHDFDCALIVQLHYNILQPVNTVANNDCSRVLFFLFCVGELMINACHFGMFAIDAAVLTRKFPITYNSIVNNRPPNAA